ncbi:MAG TPA: hypothetical protein VGF06_17940 [Terriglobales bacterium]
MKLAFMLLWCSITVTQAVPSKMLKMVVRREAPDSPPGTFAAKPKTYYRAGTQYCRIEEEPDAPNGIHGVIITNEPDSWLVNLADKSAKHVVDEGPTFNCQLPIFVAGEEIKSAADMKKELFQLEFGKELIFFGAPDATTKPGPAFRGAATTAHIRKVDGSQIYLFMGDDTGKPVAIAMQKADKRVIYWYEDFEEVPFDSKLFARPEGVTMEEVK